MAATNQRKNSVLDSDNKEILLDASYIEYSIYHLFKIDVANFIKAKALLAKEFHIQPSELDLMPAWEYEIFMKEINEAVKEENERNESEMDKYGIKDHKKYTNPSNINRMQQQSMRNMPKMPSVPNMGNFKMPSY